MEQYLDKILLVIVFITGILGFVYRNWAGFEVIYKCSKSAYWIVEQIATEKGLVSAEKIELFEGKFKYLMKWAGKYVTKENIKLALELAKKFSSKYKKVKKIDKTSEKEHILSEDKTIIWVPKEA